MERYYELVSVTELKPPLTGKDGPLTHAAKLEIKDRTTNPSSTVYQKEFWGTSRADASGKAQQAAREWMAQQS